MISFNSDVSVLSYLLLGAKSVEITDPVVEGVQKYGWLKITYEDNTVQYVGPATAFGIAKEGGYTGTLSEFETDMGNSGNNAAACATAISNCVRHDITQGLSDENKTRARTNIAAASTTVTDDLQTQVNGKYTMPNNGIPSTDMTSGVQASLSKADTSLQKASGSQAGNTVYDWALADAKPSYSASEVGAVSAKKYTVQFPSSGWTESSGAYVQTVTVEGMVSTGESIVDLDKSTTPTAEQVVAWNKVTKIATNNGSVTATCISSQPTATFNVKILVLSNVL